MPTSSSPQVAVIGGGPAGLMAAETIARSRLLAPGSVTVYDRMPTFGRKFLLAGRGGLNLTHSEDLEKFIGRYRPAGSPRMRALIEACPPAALRAWCEDLGQPTFVGSSGRVFPVAMKASPLLRAWLARLRSLGVALRPRCRWTGWDAAERLTFDTPEGPEAVRPQATILALGGASWPRLGSDGQWIAPLTSAGVAVAPLKPSNCSFVVPWSELFRQRHGGEPLKGVELGYETSSHETWRAQGDMIITQTGLEGGPLYALSAELRDAIDSAGSALLLVDLRPGKTHAELQSALSAPRGKLSLSSFLRKRLHLSPTAIGLLQEAVVTRPAPLPSGKLADFTAGQMADLIKATPVRLTATGPIERAISTAGGVTFAQLNGRLMISNRPGVFIAGEMLDWEAPTGGYLLQGCFASGAAAGKGVVEWLGEEGAQPWER